MRAAECPSPQESLTRSPRSRMVGHQHGSSVRHRQGSLRHLCQLRTLDDGSCAVIRTAAVSSRQTDGRPRPPEAAEGQAGSVHRCKARTPHYTWKLGRISHGSVSSAAVTSRNSMTSRRRSPPSYLATKNCGRPSFSATCSWVRPFALRKKISWPRNRWRGDRRDFGMQVNRSVKDRLTD